MERDPGESGAEDLGQSWPPANWWEPDAPERDPASAARPPAPSPPPDQPPPSVWPPAPPSPDPALDALPPVWPPAGSEPPPPPPPPPPSSPPPVDAPGPPPPPVPRSPGVDRSTVIAGALVLVVFCTALGIAIGRASAPRSSGFTLTPYTRAPFTYSTYRPYTPYTGYTPNTAYKTDPSGNSYTEAGVFSVQFPSAHTYRASGGSMSVGGRYASSHSVQSAMGVTPGGFYLIWSDPTSSAVTSQAAATPCAPRNGATITDAKPLTVAAQTSYSCRVGYGTSAAARGTDYAFLYANNRLFEFMLYEGTGGATRDQFLAFLQSFKLVQSGTAASPPAQGSATSAFVYVVGPWVNNDTNTQAVTRILVETREGYYTVHAFGRCSTTECDWDATTVAPGAASTTMSFTSGGAQHQLLIRPMNGILYASLDRTLLVFHRGAGAQASRQPLPDDAGVPKP